MTRQRKEIQRKIGALEKKEQAAYEKGNGFTNKLAQRFAQQKKKLVEELAATYGMALPRYEARMYEIQEMWCAGRI